MQKILNLRNNLLSRIKRYLSFQKYLYKNIDQTNVKEIFFVVGVSCTGKTMISDMLKRDSLANIAVFDFDEGGVPLVLTYSWQINRLQQLIAKAKNGEKTVIFGYIPLEAIEEISSQNKYCIKCNILILTVDKKNTLDRLLSNSTRKNIDEYLRKTKTTIEALVITNCMNSDCYTTYAAKRKIPILDTSHIDINVVYQHVRNWIIKTT